MKPMCPFFLPAPNAYSECMVVPRLVNLQNPLTRFDVRLSLGEIEVWNFNRKLSVYRRQFTVGGSCGNHLSCTTTLHRCSLKFKGDLRISSLFKPVYCNSRLNGEVVHLPGLHLTVAEIGEIKAGRLDYLCLFDQQSLL